VKSPERDVVHSLLSSAEVERLSGGKPLLPLRAFVPWTVAAFYCCV